VTVLEQRPAYRRHLPHWIPTGQAIFLTWNLKGSLPRQAREALQMECQRLQKEPPQIGESLNARHLRHQRILFALTDQYLDGAAEGPMYLRDGRAANIVVDSILFGVPKRYDLFAFVVMPNHVHVLLLPHLPLEKITQGIKGFTSRAINLLQGQQGRALWLDESFDHWVRNQDEFLRIIGYIELNPVKAGLCTTPEQWAWSSSSLRLRYSWALGNSFRPGWKPAETK
jgi:REP-associated tyrosine transposase